MQGGNYGNRRPHITNDNNPISHYDDFKDINQRNPTYSHSTELVGSYQRYQDISSQQQQNQANFNQQISLSHSFLPTRFRQYQNQQQQMHTPLSNNYTQHPMSGYTLSNSLHRLNQSEESGGVIGSNEMVGAGANTIPHDDDVDFDEDDERLEDMREGENDIEYIIMNLYSKMKNLENKYIDLANYYKQELVKSANKVQGATIDNEEPLYGGIQNRQGQISGRGDINPYNNSASPLRSQRNADLEQSPGRDSPQRRTDLPSERQIINDLIEEKRRLEDDMKQMIALKGASLAASQFHQHQQYNNNYQNLHQQSPAKQHQQHQQFQITDFKSNIPNQEQLRFLNQQLQDAFAEVIESLDQATKKEATYLSTKQNEMYQLATRYNMSAQLKNESLSLWYDARTKTQQIMTDLRNYIHQKQKQVEGNLVSSQIDSDRGGVNDGNNGNSNSIDNFNSGSLQQQLEMINNKNNSTSNLNNQKFFDDFKKELGNLKKKQDQHQKIVQKLKSQLKFKDGLLKEEHGKLGQLIRELKISINSVDDQNRRLLSGDKSQSNMMMSPFEKKIATYQKSAELRKHNNERSGSRGRPVGAPMSNTGQGFYQYRDLNNPQIMPIVGGGNQHQRDEPEIDLRILRQKQKNIELCFDDYSNKIMTKNQDIAELERQVDINSLDAARYIQQVESLIGYHQNQTIKQGDQQTRPKSRSKYGNDGNTTSPTPSYNTIKDQEKKYAELQRNNEQIYQDLRKANEKYLNQRVENNKLKDEIQMLQNSLEDAQTQLRKIQSGNTISSDQNNNQGINKSGQKITAKQSRPNRHDLSQGPSGSGHGGNQGIRQLSSNSSQLARENEELKKKIQELEKECFSLTYYQQEIQRRGAHNSGGITDPYMRAINQENNELKNKIEQLCLQVQKFMLAMRRLQRAVNNKDKDIQLLKADFEKNKKILDSMVKEIKEKEEIKAKSGFNNPGSTQNSLTMFGGQNQAVHHSMNYGISRDPRFNQEANDIIGQSNIPPSRGRSQAAKDVNTSSGMIGRQQYPITQRPYGEDLNLSSGNLPPKKGIIRPKQTPLQSQPIPTNDMQTPQSFTSHSHSQSNTGGNAIGVQNGYATMSAEIMNGTNNNNTNNTDNLDNFNNLLEEVKNIQEEKENLKSQIEDLKNKLEEERVEKNTAEVLAQSSNQSVQKLTQQLKQSGDKIYKLEKMINEYKEGLQSLENVSNLSQLAVSKLKTELLYKERDLIALNDIQQKESFVPFGSQSLQVQTAQTGEIYDKKIFDALKAQLINQIQQKEDQLNIQFKDLQLKLTDKEEDLNQVKRLFMDKLKELESSFVELSQEMVESEQVQVEASRRYQQKQQEHKQQQKQSKSYAQDLEKSLEQIIQDGSLSKNNQIEEELQEQVDQLSQLNEQLHEENGQLRQIIKQMQKEQQKQEELLLIKIQYEELQEINEHLEQNILELQSELDSSKRQSSQFKSQLDKTKQELQDSQRTKEKALSTYQTQLNELETQLLDLNNILQQEQQQRIFYESEFAKIDKTLKAVRAEKNQIEAQKEEMAHRESQMKTEIEHLKEEIQYINKLRQGDISMDNNNDGNNQIHGENNESGQNAHHYGEDNIIDAQDDEKEEQQKIQNNPREAAQHFLRLFKATKKEYKILQISKDKLDVKYQEQREKLDLLKQESRENVQELMGLEDQLQELQAQNERLTAEVEQAKGEYKVEEETVRKEVEDHFRDKIAFKDAEIQQMMEKVARISQSNLDLNAKVSRIEANNAELMQEAEQLRNKVASLEMELEMTHLNNERDLDKLQSQRQEEQQLLDEKLQQIQQEKALLQQKIDKKRIKMVSLKENHQIALHQQQEQIKQEMEQQMRAKLEEKDKEAVERIETEKRIAKEESQRIRMEQEQEREAERQLQLERQQQELELLLASQKQSHKNLLDQHVQDLSKKHQQEKELLEQKLKEEKANQEKMLLEGEKEKIERIRVQMEQERQQREKQILVEQEQLRQQLQEKMELEQQQREEQLLQEQTRKLEDFQAQLSQQMAEEQAKKNKERNLAIMLKSHLQKLVKRQLERAIEEKKQQEREVALIREEMVKKEQLAEREKQEQIQQYEQELKELQHLKEQELLLIEQNLKQQQEEQEKRKKKENALMYALQKKARQIIIQKLEEERALRVKEQENAKKEIEDLISQKEQEMLQMNETNKIKLETLKHQLHQKSQQDQEDLKEKLEKEIDNLAKNSQTQINQKQEEIDRLRQEQQELIKSLSEKQDQQTKDLLNQKEREKEQLKHEMEQLKSSLDSHYSQELAIKQKQTRLLFALQTKIRKDLESRMRKTVEVAQQESQERMREVERIKKEQQQALRNSEGKSIEEQEKIKKQMQEILTEKERILQEKEQEALKIKEEQDLILESINKKKAEELSELQQNINTLQQEIQDQQQYIQQLETYTKEQEEEINNLKNEQNSIISKYSQELEYQKRKLEEEKEKHNEEIQNLIEENDEKLQEIENAVLEKEQQYAEEIKSFENTIKSLEQQLEQQQKDFDAQNLALSQQLTQIQQESQKQADEQRRQMEENIDNINKKKEQEKLQAVEDAVKKVKDESNQQIQEKDKLISYLNQEIKELKQDLQNLQNEIDLERKENQDNINLLNQEKDKLINQVKSLTEESNKLKADLEQIQKIQSESENQQIKDLSEKVSNLQSQCNQLNQDKKKLETQIESLTTQLKEKTEEVQNLENDLGSLYDQIEEEKQKNEQAQQQMNDKLDLLQSMKDKDKKDSDMQIKLKETLMKKLQEQLEENERQIVEKQTELQSEMERRQKDKKRVQELEAQVKAMNQQHEEELEQIQRENLDLKQEIELLKKKQKQNAANNLEQSIDEIENKLGEFNIQLSQLKKQSAEIEKQKRLNDSLIENVEKDENSEIIFSDINSSSVQYCKRVKYLENAWILISKQNQYYWVNQIKIPVEKLQKINVQEIEENTGKLEERLKELRNEKDQLIKMIKATKNGQQFDGEQVSLKALELENQELRAQVNDYKVANNTLQQSTLSLKQRVNELNDMIFGLADTDKSHDNINKFVELHKKKEELSQKLLEQIETIQRLESENDSLKKQLQENEYSFARGGGKSFAQLKPENFDLNTSSIDHKNEDEFFNNNNGNMNGAGNGNTPQNNNQALQEKISKLESEMEELQKLQDALKFENKSLKEQQLKASQSMTQNAEALEAYENIKHVKSLFIQFLSKVPIMTGNGEELLPVILSMMMLSKEETAALARARDQLTKERQVKDQVKKGVLGGLFTKKPQQPPQ